MTKRTTADEPVASERDDLPHKICLLVLGMHRSGTSALTRVLSLHGAALPKNLLGANHSNETGHWEPERLIELHDRMLAETGSRWDDWRAISFEEMGRARRKHYLAETMRIISEEYGDARLIVLKEPRISRFVPVYRTVLERLGYQTKFIHTNRNPLAVAASLGARDGMDEDHALLLWLRHELDAEVATRGLPRVFVSYEDLVRDWHGVIARIDAEMPGLLKAGDAVEEAVDSFLSPTLQRQGRSLSELSIIAEDKPWLGDAYDALLSLEVGDKGKSVSDTLDRVRSRFDDVAGWVGSSVIGSLRAAAEQSQRVQKAYEDQALHLIDENRRLSEELPKYEKQAQAMAAEMARLQAEAEVAHRSARESEERLGAAEEALSRVRSELEARAQADRDFEDQTRANREALAAAEARLGSDEVARRAAEENASRLTVDLEDARAALSSCLEREQASRSEAERLRETLAVQENTLAQISTSTIWRAAHPIRRTGMMLPQGLRTSVRRLMMLLWWLVTPWAMPRRIRERRARRKQQEVVASVGPVAITDLASDRQSEDRLEPSSGEPEHTEHVAGEAGPLWNARAEDVALASLLAESEWFDADYYLEQADPEARRNPALHYVVFGENSGLKPSTAFDPIYYSKANPDLRLLDCLFAHYVLHGRNEGRRAVPVADRITIPTRRICNDRQTVFLIVHETTRTGAPIVAWNLSRELSRHYNVIVLAMSGGGIYNAFEADCCEIVGPIGRHFTDQDEVNDLASRLVSIYSPVYAIASSAATVALAAALGRQLVPVVSLVHEFAETLEYPESVRELVEWSSEVVFPAEIVAESTQANYPLLGAMRYHILPQGACALPLCETDVDQKPREAPNFRTGEWKDAFIVLGIGTVHDRKGVDLFVSVAQALQTKMPSGSIRFVWIGARVSYPGFERYNLFLDEQIKRSDIKDGLVFVDELSSLDEVYCQVDALFVSSRLDPFPNTAIDALVRGIPVICFEKATGVAELLREDEVTRNLVVPYLDLVAVTETIVELARESNYRAEVSQACKSVAEMRLKINRYVDMLDKIGRDASSRMARMRKYFEILERSDMVRKEMLTNKLDCTFDDAAARHLMVTAKIDYSRDPVYGSTNYVRRAAPNFHPYIYVRERRKQPMGEPLIGYLAEGKPEGPWLSDLIFLDEVTPDALRPDLRVALQAHFHYTDNIAELFERLSSNEQDVDVYISTTSIDKARAIESLCSRQNYKVAEITHGPNRGRDVGPFIEFLRQHASKYNIIGHVHGKRSVHVDSSIGGMWRAYLWQHLLGGPQRSVDIIMDRFARNADVGLVFPTEAHILGWESNTEIGEEIARKMGFQGQVPQYFDFPVGTMFWARPQALAPIRNLELSWECYPEEPLPIDGTLLHALERLISISNEISGFKHSKTFIEGLTR